jgi:hypothetical protein
VEEAIAEEKSLLQTWCMPGLRAASATRRSSRAARSASRRSLR